jgi:GNAT superfamily N-acetyltransferase
MSLLKVENSNDIISLSVMAHTIWNEYFPPIIGQEQVDYMVEKFQSESALIRQLQEGYEYYFICNGDKTVGYTGVVPKPEISALQISKLYLLKDARGKGHGRDTVAEICELARSKGFTQLYLTVNKYNDGTIAAYKHMGFSIKDEIVMDIEGGFVMDDYEMEKSITN